VRTHPALVTACVLLAIVGLLQVAASAGVTNTFLFPSPLEVAESFPDLIAEEGLLARFAMTAGEVFLAASLAIVVGGLLGGLLYSSRIAWDAFASWIVGFNAAPLILLYPLFLMIFGRNPSVVVVLGVLGALPVIVLKTREAFVGVPKVLLEVGRSFNLPRSRQIRLILLPAATPTIVAGARLGCFYALSAVIGAEFLTGIGGLGALIPDLADRYKLAEMYGAIVFVVVTSAVFILLVNSAGRWLRPV
jgi:ABC-type nitrate/sulfonate/bicarbonate transport system permease component